MTLVTPGATGPWYAKLARSAGLALLRWSRKHGATFVIPGQPLAHGGVIQRARHILIPRPGLIDHPYWQAKVYGWYVPGDDAEIVSQLMPEPTTHQGSRRV